MRIEGEIGTNLRLLYSIKDLALLKVAFRGHVGRGDDSTSRGGMLCRRLYQPLLDKGKNPVQPIALTENSVVGTSRYPGGLMLVTSPRNLPYCCSQKIREEAKKNADEHLPNQTHVATVLEF